MTSPQDHGFLTEGNPYLIEGPALISFSGGRTSAYMLRMILDAHGGTLPDDVHVCFANTGKEREETLRFVHECATRWGVRVRWLEFVTDLASVGPEGRFEEVGFNSASRDGEPFDRLIARKKAIPSTQTGRWCTEYLKVRVLFDFAMSAGLGAPGDFAEIIGLRSDEGDRIANLRKKARNGASHLIFPLSTAGVRKSDIFRFWSAQDFDLALPRGYGNCDHCPFVGDQNRVARARFDPAGTFWWARHELDKGFRFGRNLSVVEVLGFAGRAPLLVPDDNADAECGLWCSGEAA